MSKKIIAILAVITILFVCVFAACEKKDKEDLYKDADEFLFVTDENGDKVLSDDGRLIVYVTDEDGKRQKQPDGEYVTREREFEPIIDDVSKNPVRLILSENSLKIKCLTTLGSVNDKFNVDYSGSDFEIGFNYRYLYDAISRCGNETTVLRMNSPIFCDAVSTLL